MYLAPGASIESVVPPFKVVIRPDSLSIYAPGLRGKIELSVHVDFT